MKWNTWIRQSHRWLSIAFTFAVIVNFAILGWKARPMWIVYSPLLPLFLLMFSGLHMFLLPYAVSWQRRERARTQS